MRVFGGGQHPFRGRRFPEAGSIHLHTTDTPGEWLVRLGPDGIHLTREHAKGDVAVRGPASDVLLVLMGRKTMDAADVLYGVTMQEAGISKLVSVKFDRIGEARQPKDRLRVASEGRLERTRHRGEAAA